MSITVTAELVAQARKEGRLEGLREAVDLVRAVSADDYEHIESALDYAADIIANRIIELTQET